MTESPMPRSGLVRDDQGDVLAYWPIDLEPTASDLTARAYALVATDRTSSAPGLLALAQRDRAAVERDADLSAKGKAGKIAAIARSRLANLAPLASSVQKLRAEYLAREQEALRLPEPSSNDLQIDLALARHVREVGEGAVRLRLLGSERTKLAVARLPPELSGLNPAEHDKVRHSLVPASVAQQLDDEARALMSAREAVQKALDHLVDFAPDDISHRELVELFGDGWKLRGHVSAEDRKARIAAMFEPAA